MTTTPIPPLPSPSRYHPYSLNANSNINTNLLKWRRGPPSIASSTTSYAQSIVSTSTSLAPSQSRQNSLRIKVDTNAAPSSHIWDEFYKEHGRPVSPIQENREEDEENVQTGGEDTPRASSNPLPANDVQMARYAEGGLGLDFGGDINGDMSITELLSMFALPQVASLPSNLAEVDSHPQNTRSQQDGIADYPGAEFLNLPDTASTTDAHYPGLEGFDFGGFDFASFINPTMGIEDGVPTTQPGNWNISDIYQHNSPPGQTVPNGRIKTVPANAQDTSTSSSSTFSSVPHPAPIQADPASQMVQKHTQSIPNEENNKTSQPQDSDKCTQSSSKSSTISSKSLPHLRRLKMRSMSSDKDVIRFQKKVLGIAAKFYTSLADLFENTPNDVIKLGMTRTGIVVEDEIIPHVLEDIKSLCKRLTARASDIPGYPTDGEDTQTSSEESIHHHTKLKACDPTPESEKTAGHLRQKGSLAEPIDLTASTPRSPRSKGSTPAPPLLPKDTLSAIPPHRNGHLTPGRTAGLSTSPPSIKPKRFHDPFTPESLGIGPASVQATTSPMGPVLTPAYTPASHVNATTPAGPRVSLDLPPLSVTNNRVVHGPWKPSEVERLRTLVAFSQDVEDNAPIDHTDWTWVVDNFGGTRNRHQVLIKAVELGLRETSTHHSRRVKQKGYRDALAAMENELEVTANNPLTSPLPPLLPSAQITSKRTESPDPSSLMPFRGASEPPLPEFTPSKSGMEHLVDYSLSLADTGRRKSSGSTPAGPATSTSRPGVGVNIKSPKALPRALALDLSTPTRSAPQRIGTSPIRGLASSTPTSSGSPFTPRSRLNTMGFKPYAHPTSQVGSNTAPPKVARRPMHVRSYSGFSLVPMPGLGAGDASRPTVISPTFGSFGMKGYQLAPLLGEDGVDDRSLKDQ
ncbi:uncharacterized protein I303_108553 [Kwoniella dejecticola CBS 10117]|uniref:Uncharacterized protein n=1 Tax=Kwoniella dejecticola CBS 10117 TaxID=1296121 RepID=A0A1A5ZX28_9TREE|nr:uncharacterized protein I303_07122 [Kwoniella dejecticola CBS 10117]OBR82363.1 hypothetical protein I303_07122 [Kwoniella dejecticola CBS 10117]